MELKTMQEIKNEVAESYGAGNWVDLLNDFKNGNIPFKDMKQRVDEAMKLYTLQIAEAACKEQRELCAKKLVFYPPMGLMQGETFTENKHAVLNTPQPDIDKLLK